MKDLNIIERIRRLVFKEKNSNFFYIIYVYLKDSSKENFLLNYELFHEELLFNRELAKLIDELYSTISFSKFKKQLLKIYDQELKRKFTDRYTNYYVLSELTYLVTKEYLLDLLKENDTRRNRFCYLYKELSKIFVDDFDEELKDEDFIRALEIYQKYAKRPDYWIIDCLKNKETYLARGLINVLKWSV